MFSTPRNYIYTRGVDVCLSCCLVRDIISSSHTVLVFLHSCTSILTSPLNTQFTLPRPDPTRQNCFVASSECQRDAWERTICGYTQQEIEPRHNVLCCCCCFFSFLLFLFCHRATVHVCFLSIVTNKRIIHQCDEPTDGQDRLARRTLTTIVSCICRLADLSAHKLSSCYWYIVTATSNMQFATAHKCRRHSFLLIDRRIAI